MYLLQLPCLSDDKAVFIYLIYSKWCGWLLLPLEMHIRNKLVLPTVCAILENKITYYIALKTTTLPSGLSCIQYCSCTVSDINIWTLRKLF